MSKLSIHDSILLPLIMNYYAIAIFFYIFTIFFYRGSDFERFAKNKEDQKIKTKTIHQVVYGYFQAVFFSVLIGLTTILFKKDLAIYLSACLNLFMIFLVSVIFRKTFLFKD